MITNVYIVFYRLIWKTNIRPTATNWFIRVSCVRFGPCAKKISNFTTWRRIMHRIIQRMRRIWIAQLIVDLRNQLMQFRRNDVDLNQIRLCTCINNDLLSELSFFLLRMHVRRFNCSDENLWFSPNDKICFMFVLISNIFQGKVIWQRSAQLVSTKLLYCTHSESLFVFFCHVF